MYSLFYSTQAFLVILLTGPVQNFESLKFDGSHHMAHTDVNIALRYQHLPPFFYSYLVTLYKNADCAFSLALKIS